MSSTSDELNLSAMVGKPLAQIRLDPFSVQFLFHSGHNIATQGIADVCDGKLIISKWTQNTGWSTIHYQKLLHNKIVECSLEEDENALCIKLENNLTLSVQENYSVQPGNFFHC